MTYWKRQSYGEGKQISGCQVMGAEGGAGSKGARGNWGDGNVPLEMF